MADVAKLAHAMQVLARALQEAADEILADEAGVPRSLVPQPCDEQVLSGAFALLSSADCAMRVGEMAARISSARIPVTPARLTRLLRAWPDAESSGQGWWRLKDRS